jgi:hypothetical protein
MRYLQYQLRPARDLLGPKPRKARAGRPVEPVVVEIISRPCKIHPTAPTEAELMVEIGMNINDPGWFSTVHGRCDRA